MAVLTAAPSLPDFQACGEYCELERKALHTGLDEVGPG